MRNEKGFSLIELLIVVSIMLVIAAVAVPAVIASAQAGNETAAVNTLRTFITAENGYHQLTGFYSSTATDLGGPVGDSLCPNVPTITLGPPSTGPGCFMPDAVASRIQLNLPLNGYVYHFANGGTGDGSAWTLSATPSSSMSGRKSFFCDQSGVIRYNLGASGATVADLPLGT
jgi:type IV pilus assembly protein PilA